MAEPMEKGHRIDRYVVETCLAFGKRAAVYRCVDPELERVVAVYYVHAEAPAETTTGLIQSQRFLASMLHPNIVTTYDGGEHLGRRFSVMEYIDGGSLHDFIVGGVKVPWATIMRIGASIAGAVKYAHQRGVVDIRVHPMSIGLRSTGEPILLEVYRARRTTAGQRVDGEHLVANECAAICGTLASLLLGRERPYGSESNATVTKWLEEADLPSYLTQVLARGLGRSTMEPYLDLGQMGSALRAAADQLDHQATDGVSLSLPEPGETVILHVEHREEDRPGAYREYQLLEHVSEGSFGDVYRALDQHAEQPIALKILKRKWIHDQNAVERFRREAELMSELVHPNIVRVFNFGRYGQSMFIAMEFIEGPTLSAWSRGRAHIDVAETLEIMVAVLRGLAASAAAEIVHRDVKPDNIKIAADGPKLLDFGVAKAKRKETLTETGAFVGTLRYASPEQVRGISPTPATDVYSAGVILYELVTGTHPQEADGMASLMMAIVNTPPRAVSEIRRDLPHGLAQMIHAMLAKRPEERPTAMEAAERLEGLYSSLSTRVDPGS